MYVCMYIYTYICKTSICIIFYSQQLNFTNFIKNGQSSIVLATVVRKLTLAKINSFSHLHDCTFKTIFNFYLTLPNFSFLAKFNSSKIF